MLDMAIEKTCVYVYKSLSEVPPYSSSFTKSDVFSMLRVFAGTDVDSLRLQWPSFDDLEAERSHRQISPANCMVSHKQS